MKIKNEIRNFTSARLGAFGEFIYKHYVEKVKKVSIKGVHKEGKDFEVKGVKIDVGATRKDLGKDFSARRKIKDKDAYVFFSKNGVYINCEITGLTKSGV